MNITLINTILFYENNSVLKHRVTPRLQGNYIIKLSFYPKYFYVKLTLCKTITLCKGQLRVTL